MDDLLSEFLTETSESLDVVDVELVKFEQEPNNAQILDNVFRLVHTIKGTCGFLGLPRLESLAHAGESLMGKFRDGAPVTPDAVSLILKSIDRIKEILAELGNTGAEPEGSDDDLISELDRMSEEGARAISGEAPAEVKAEAAPADTEAEAEPAAETEAGEDKAEGELVYQVLERPLKPGEVSLDELERAFMEAEGPDLSVAEPAEAKAPVEEKKAEAKPKGPAKGQEAPVQQASLRVNVETLEHLITMVSELVLTRNQLLEIVRRHEDSEFKVPLQRLSNVTAELQEGVMKTRMQPIGRLFHKYPRIARDLARNLGKEVELALVGEDTEIDKTMVEDLSDPIIHLIRNAVDHGIEDPAGRAAAGKPAKSVLRLEARQEGDHIVITVADDGRGMDPEKLRAKALAQGVITAEEASTLDERQSYDLIFLPGFSTAEKVSDVSGRGVGMDVVRTNIQKLNGSIEIQSQLGKGTTLLIHLPLTLAILPVLLVRLGEQPFAVPLSMVREILPIEPGGIQDVGGKATMVVRGEVLPIVPLSALLGWPREEVPQYGVVMQSGASVFILAIDSFAGREDAVIKSLEVFRPKGVAGVTTLANGQIVLILDMKELLESAGERRSVSRSTLFEAV